MPSIIVVLNGRLITFRLVSLIDDRSVVQAAHQLLRVIGPLSDLPVICADVTAMQQTSPATIERFVQAVQVGKPRIERCAMLTSAQGATFLLPIERMPCGVRSFRKMNELTEWLRPILSHDEQNALLSFLVRSQGLRAKPDTRRGIPPHERQY